MFKARYILCNSILSKDFTRIIKEILNNMKTLKQVPWSETPKNISNTSVLKSLKQLKSSRFWDHYFLLLYIQDTTSNKRRQSNLRTPPPRPRIRFRQNTFKWKKKRLFWLYSPSQNMKLPNHWVHVNCTLKC